MCPLPSLTCSSTGCIQCHDRLHSDVHTRNLERLKHHLYHSLSVKLGVHRSFRQHHRVGLGLNTQLVICALPHLEKTNKQTNIETNKHRNIHNSFAHTCLCVLFVSGLYMCTLTCVWICLRLFVYLFVRMDKWECVLVCMCMCVCAVWCIVYINEYMYIVHSLLKSLKES